MSIIFRFGDSPVARKPDDTVKDELAARKFIFQEDIHQAWFFLKSTFDLDLQFPSFDLGLYLALTRTHLSEEFKFPLHQVSVLQESIALQLLD